MAQGVPVVAMHRSTSWNTTEGLRIDTGMYLIGMEETSGRKATAVGKPAPEGFLAAAAGSAWIPTRCTWSATTSTTTCWPRRWPG